MFERRCDSTVRSSSDQRISMRKRVDWALRAPGCPLIKNDPWTVHVSAHSTRDIATLGVNTYRSKPQVRSLPSVYVTKLGRWLSSAVVFCCD
jgi:hypothetical protein